MRDDRLLFFMLTSLCCALAFAAQTAHGESAKLPVPSATLQQQVRQSCLAAVQPLAATGWPRSGPVSIQAGTSAPDQPPAVVCTVHLAATSGKTIDIRIEANAASGGFLTHVPFSKLAARAPVTQAYRSKEAEPSADVGSGAAGPATILFVGTWRPLAGEDGSYGCDFLFPDAPSNEEVYDYFVRIDAPAATADAVIAHMDWSALTITAKPSAH